MKCRICNRPLKNPAHIRLGIGPVCAKKQGYNNAREADTGDIIHPYDGGDIWIRRVSSDTVTERGNLQSLKHAASGIETNVRHAVKKHSPSGFNFGYGGSGPADFALNVMLMFCKHADDAYLHYQDFKFRFVAKTDKDNENSLTIRKNDIVEFLNEKNIQSK